MKRLTVEAGAESIVIRIDPSGETAAFPLVKGAFGDGAKMAEPAAGWLRERTKSIFGSSCEIIVSARRSAIRFAKVPANFKLKTAEASKFTREYFPWGAAFNETTHNVGCEIFTRVGGDNVLMLAALPVEIVESLVGMCAEWKIPGNKIKRVVPKEFMLLRRVCALYSEPFVLCLPQESGIRLLTAEGGAPAGAFYISGDPAFRKAELDRIFSARVPPREGETVFIEKFTDELEWLRNYFTGRGFIFKDEPCLRGELNYI